MSNYKRTYVTVEQEELQRLQNALNRLRTVESTMPELVASIQQVNRREISQAMDTVLQRQQADRAVIDQRIHVLQTGQENLTQQQREIRQRVAEVLVEVQQSEQRTTDNLRQQRKELLDRIERSTGELRRETQRLLQEQNQRLQTAIDREQKARQQAINDVNNRLNAMQQKERYQEEWARQWIDEAESESQKIEKNHRPEQFRPGELNALRARVQAARRKLSTAPQAALGQAEEAYTSLLALRQQLEVLEAAWDLARAQALAGLDEVLVIAAANRRCKASDIEGKETDISLEVDHWTNDKLSDLEKKVQALRDNIMQQTPPPATQDLQKLVETQVPEWQSQIEGIKQEARLAAIASQRRRDLANLAVGALVDQGFDYDGSVYEGSDDREAFHAKVVDGAGNAIVIRVAPTGDQSLGSEVNIVSLDKDKKTPVELRTRAQQVNEVLRENGVPAPDLTEVPNVQPPTSWGNLKEVAKPVPRERQQSTQIPRPR